VSPYVFTLVVALVFVVMAEVENPMGAEPEMDEDALLADFDAGLKKKKKKKKKPVSYAVRCV